MKCTVIGVTEETNGLSDEQLHEAKTFCGKNAGICYQREGYFGTSVSDPVKASERFPTVSSTGHHSIADHVRVEVLLEDVSKMLAIVLNSLQDYSTSEKSGRYTVMTGNSKEEQELYEKWLSIFKKRILEIEPSLDDDMLMTLMAKKGHDDVIISNGELSNDSMADSDEVHQNILLECKKNISLPSTKMAQENARYVLSVFTRSTTMGYSTSIRQWNYIYDWCKKYMSQYEFSNKLCGVRENAVLVNKETGIEASYFEGELYKDFDSLSTFIKDNLYVEELRDNKNRCFEFLTSLSGDKDHPMANYDVVEPNILTGETDRFSDDDKLDVSYQVSYPASFVHIAQAERHRTLKYFMKFNPYNHDKVFFVPPCIKGTNWENEWLEDLKTVESFIPQATTVGIIETGNVSDFILKCEERCCGRAQWEIMHQTEETAKRFIATCVYGVASSTLKAYVKKFTGKNNSVATKCMMLGGCKERCRFGSKLDEVFTRKF